MKLGEFIMLAFLLTIAIWCASTMAFGQEAPTDAGAILAGFLAGVPSLGKMLGFAMTLQICLRLLAELLIKISALTETNADNKVAAWVSEASWVLGLVISKFGYSVPKVIIEEKAKELPKV